MILFKLPPNFNLFSFTDTYKTLKERFGAPGFTETEGRWWFHYSDRRISNEVIVVAIYFRDEADDLLARLII